VRVDVTPDILAVEPGQRAALSVSIFNDETVIIAYRIRVLGLDPTWVNIDQPRLSLFPDTAGETAVLLNLPDDAPAGTRRIGIEVTSLTEPAITEIVEIETVTPSEPQGRLDLEPVSVFGTRVGTFGVSATNEGNTPLELEFEGDDADDHLTYRFDPPIVRIAPGERQHVQAVARGRRPFLGSPVAHVFTISAVDRDTVTPATGSLIQRAWVSRGALSLFGLIAAVSVFAVVLTTSLNRVVDRSRAGEQLLLDVIRGDSADSAIDNPGSISGTVTLLTSGAPVSGVTADLFRADDPDRPAASTATEEAGTYTFEGLGEGTYKVRFRGAGFTELWYPASLNFDDANEVDVGAGQSVAGVDVRLGGIPGSITGTVIGDDVTGANVTLQVPADVIDGEVDAIVRSAVVDATGQFVLEDVPAPSSYVLRVDKLGYASGVRLVNIGAGEQITGVEVALRSGDGSISGRVVDDAGPLGGATIIASSGTSEIRTASLTQDDIGAFILRDLPTPATYTIEVSAPGYVTETFAIRLSTTQQLDQIEVRLRAATGSISGVVAIVGEGAIGGVLVTVSDGAQIWRSETLSVGTVGSYRVDDLPVPGTYTVTFSRTGLASQIRSVDLDAFVGANRTDVNANLTRASAAVLGQVTDEGGNPLGGVQVTATSGDTTRVTISANDPPGRYELRDLPAGTYTITFERPGSQARAVLVALAGGQDRTLDVVLSPQASLRGIVTLSGVPAGGLQVRIFRIETYPSTILAVAITQDDGSYVFEGLEAPQTFVVEYLNAGGAVVGTETITLLAGEQRTGANFDIP
jgi:5-hydroxyisourate hydrolase-like protein (transthyretin family)